LVRCQDPIEEKEARLSAAIFDNPRTLTPVTILEVGLSHEGSQRSAKAYFADVY
jgi:hypothetical protein